MLGMNEREAIESGFCKLHPEVNIKEVKDLFAKMTQRKKPTFLPNHEKPGNSRSKCWFYLRPHFYELVSDLDKSKFGGWEAAKTSDDILFDEEIKAKEDKVKASRDKEKEKKRLKREANGQPPAKRGRKSKKDIAAEAAAAKLAEGGGGGGAAPQPPNVPMGVPQPPNAPMGVPQPPNGGGEVLAPVASPTTNRVTAMDTTN